MTTRAHSYGMTAARKYNRVEGDEFESPTFLDGSPFKAYMAIVEAFIHAAGSPVTTRALHDGLGADARQEWTQDALDMIPTIKPTGLLPTRYQPKDGLKPRLMIPKSEQMKWLFPLKAN